jgi:hypothetical protein
MVKPDHPHQGFRLGNGYGILEKDVFYDKWGVHVNDMSCHARLQSICSEKAFRFGTVNSSDDDQAFFECKLLVDEIQGRILIWDVTGRYYGLVQEFDFAFKGLAQSQDESHCYDYEYDRLVFQEAIPIIKIVLEHRIGRDFGEFNVEKLEPDGKPEWIDEMQESTFEVFTDLTGFTTMPEFLCEIEFPTHIVTRDESVFGFF